MQNNYILIIGKSLIALRHYKILKSKLSEKKFFFLGRNKQLFYFNGNKFLNLKKKFNLDKICFYMIVICTTSDKHIFYLKKFYKNTKHIFVEKPFSNNLKEAQNFLKYYKTSRIKPKIQIGYNLRYLKSLKKFKLFVDNKKMGKIYYVNCYVGKSLDQWRNGKLNFAASKKNGGGALLELSHEIDYLKWIFGSLKLKTSYINPLKKFNYDIDQNVFAILSSESSGYKKIPINLTMDIINNIPERYCEIICEKGNIKLDIKLNKLEILTKKNNNFINFNKKDLDQSYIDQLVFFINSKENNSVLNIKDSIKTLEIIKKIKK